MKPPRSVWVVVNHMYRVMSASTTKARADGRAYGTWSVVRYDLHRPKKRKARKGGRGR